MKTSIAAIVTAAALVLTASAPALAATSDNETSSKNDKLSCTVSVSEQGDKVVVTWTITGATSASISPLTFDGKVPLKGSQTVDKTNPFLVQLTAKDADGNAVHCRAGIGGTYAPASGSTGYASPKQIA